MIDIYIYDIYIYVISYIYNYIYMCVQLRAFEHDAKMHSDTFVPDSVTQKMNEHMIIQW